MSSSEVAPQSLDMQIKREESPKKIPEHPATKEFEPVLKLDKLEEGLRHEDFSHDTEDREDHTFCGIMVDVSCSATLPCEYVEVNSVWVRGDLGPMTVYSSEQSYHECMNDAEAWTVRHKGEYESSFHALVELKLEPPLRVLSGQKAGLYVHSTRPDDQAVVYDNMHHSRYADDSDEEESEDEDDENKDENEAGGSGVGARRRRKKRKPALSISIGQAALSDSPFDGYAPWGAGPWRRQREFVGRISYGVRWMLWTPELHRRFPLGFRAAAEAMLMGAKRTESPLYCLRDEVIFYIMNRCGWEWFGSEFEPSQEEEEEEKLPPHPAFSRLFGGQGHRAYNGDNQAVLHLLHSLGMHAVQMDGNGEYFIGGQHGGDDEDGDDEDEDDEYNPGVYEESSDEDGEDEDEEDVGGREEPDTDEAAEEVVAVCACSSGQNKSGNEAGTSSGA